jgi:hypothetical protein
MWGVFLFWFVIVTFFQVMGMTMLGTMLREIIPAIREHGCRSIGQGDGWLRLIFGGVVVLIATLFGYAVLPTALIVLQVAIGFAALVASLLGIQGTLFARLKVKQVSIIIFGAFFFIVGMGIGGQMVRQGEVISALFFGLIFCGLGGVTVLIGFRRLVAEE